MLSSLELREGLLHLLSVFVNSGVIFSIYYSQKRQNEVLAK